MASSQLYIDEMVKKNVKQDKLIRYTVRCIGVICISAYVCKSVYISAHAGLELRDRVQDCVVPVIHIYIYNAIRKPCNK